MNSEPQLDGMNQYFTSHVKCMHIKQSYEFKNKLISRKQLLFLLVKLKISHFKFVEFSETRHIVNQTMNEP